MTAVMVRMQNAIQDRDDRGATIVEYGLLLVFVALVAIAGLTTLGSGLKTQFGIANEAFANSPAGTPLPTSN